MTSLHDRHKEKIDALLNELRAEGKAA